VGPRGKEPAVCDATCFGERIEAIRACRCSLSIVFGLSEDNDQSSCWAALDGRVLRQGRPSLLLWPRATRRACVRGAAAYDAMMMRLTCVLVAPARCARAASRPIIRKSTAIGARPSARQSFAYHLCCLDCATVGISTQSAGACFAHSKAVCSLVQQIRAARRLLFISAKVVQVGNKHRVH